MNTVKEIDALRLDVILAKIQIAELQIRMIQSEIQPFLIQRDELLARMKKDAKADESAMYYPERREFILPSSPVSPVGV